MWGPHEFSIGIRSALPSHLTSVPSFTFACQLSLRNIKIYLDDCRRGFLKRLIPTSDIQYHDHLSKYVFYAAFSLVSLLTHIMCLMVSQLKSQIYAYHIDTYRTAPFRIVPQHVSIYLHKIFVVKNKHANKFNKHTLILPDLNDEHYGMGIVWYDCDLFLNLPLTKHICVLYLCLLGYFKSVRETTFT